METHFKEKGAEDAVKKVNGVIRFEISAKKGDTPKVFTIDLKNGKGN